MKLTIEQMLQQGIAAQNEGKLKEAENFYRNILEIEPSHQHANHNLGILNVSVNKVELALPLFKAAIKTNPKIEQFWLSYIDTLIKKNEIEEAEIVSRKALDQNKDSIKVNNVLSDILLKLGRLNEAETYLRKEIILKSDNPVAHNNLGSILKQLGKLDEAEASLRQAIIQKPDFVEAHYNLGNTLFELGKLDEAEASLRQATIQKPDFAEAHSNLGNILIELGRLDDAEVSLKQALVLKPDLVDAIFNLSLTLDYMNNLDEVIPVLEKLMEIDPDNRGLKAGVHLAILQFLENNFSDSKKILIACQNIQEKTTSDFNNHKLYQYYLLKMLSNHEKNSPTLNSSQLKKKLYVIGESHSLVSHGLQIQILGEDFSCKSLLVPGCKQFDLGNNMINKFKYKFKNIFCSLPKNSLILLVFGEIDCRLNGGILKHRDKHPQNKLTDLIENTVENYLNYIFKLNSACEHNIIIQGVPCPNINIKDISTVKIEELIYVIREFNSALKDKSKKKGFGFLDVHKLTDNGNGFSNNVWNLDAFHLSHEGMYEAWRLHARYK